MKKGFVYICRAFSKEARGVIKARMPKFSSGNIRRHPPRNPIRPSIPIKIEYRASKGK